MTGLLSEHGRLSGFRPLPDDITRRFVNTQPHAAMEEAVAWCLDRGFSIGPHSKGSPRALKRGLHCLPHWTQLDARDRAKIDGAIIAHCTEFGPIVVRIRRRAADITLLEAS